MEIPEHQVKLWKQYHDLGENRYGSNIESELFSYFLQKYKSNIISECSKTYRYNKSIKDDLISFCHIKLLSCIRGFKNYETRPFIFFEQSIKYAILDCLRKYQSLRNNEKHIFFKNSFFSIEQIEFNAGFEISRTKYINNYFVDDTRQKAEYRELVDYFYDFCKFKKYKKRIANMLFNIIFNNWQQKYYVKKFKYDKAIISKLIKKTEAEFIEFCKSKIRTSDNKRIIAFLKK